MWELPGHLSRSTRAQSTPQNSRYETRRLLRGQGLTTGRAMHLGHDVRGAKVARTWSEGSRTAMSVLYRPSEGIRLCRPLPSLADIRRATAADCNYPPVP